MTPQEAEVKLIAANKSWLLRESSMESCLTIDTVFLGADRPPISTRLGLICEPNGNYKWIDIHDEDNFALYQSQLVKLDASKLADPQIQEQVGQLYAFLNEHGLTSEDQLVPNAEEEQTNNKLFALYKRPDGITTNRALEPYEEEVDGRIFEVTFPSLDEIKAFENITPMLAAIVNKDINPLTNKPFKRGDVSISEAKSIECKRSNELEHQEQESKAQEELQTTTTKPSRPG